MPAIRLEQVSKKYGAVTALDTLNLSIKSGELFGFIGPNGAGKTTLIRVLTGIIRPTTGDVDICGFSLLKQPNKAKALVGYVPDRPYLYEKLTPLEYFEFVSGLYGINANSAIKKSEELLKIFDLWGKRNDLIESFSHGMKQKIAMCGACLHDPKVFIVDEPTVGLDPKSIKLTKRFLKEMTENKKTVFLTTHTLSVAQDLCTDIAIICKGGIIARGSIEELQKMAKMPDNSLEDVFLELTRET